VWLSGMARGLLGKGHPLHMRHKRREALKEADVVVLAGVPADFRLNYGRHLKKSTQVIAVGRKRSDLYRNRWPALAAVCDAGAFLHEVAHEISDDDSRWSSWREQLRARDDERDVQIRDQSKAKVEGNVNPLSLCLDMEELLAKDSVLVADGGDFVATASYTLR